jgi:hypothetical protein
MSQHAFPCPLDFVKLDEYADCLVIGNAASGNLRGKNKMHSY